MKTDYEFKGWDWMELAEAFEVEAVEESAWLKNPDAADENTAERIRAKFWADGCGEGCPEAAALVRKFLLKLAECEDSCSPVWKALASIDHDFTMLRLFGPLVRYAWN